MKLWRKTHLPDGTPQLKEVTSAAEIDTSKPVVIVMHGVDSGTNSKEIGKVVGGNIKQVETLLGTSWGQPEVEVLAVSYDSRIKTALKTPVKNWRLDKHRDREADALVRDFLAPLVEQGVNPTLYAYSMGSLFADNVRGSMIRHYREAGKSDAEIGQTLQDICLVSGGSASNAVNPNSKNREHDLDFTSVFFAFSNDKKAAIANPYSFHQTRRPHHEEGKVSVTQLSGNRLQVMADAPREMKHWRHTKDGVELHHVKQKTPGTLWIAANHHSDFTTYRGTTVPEVELMTPYMERALRNAVRRTGAVKVDDLLNPAAPLSNQTAAHGASSSANQQEDLAIADAKAKKQSWVSRADAKEQAKASGR